MRWSSKGDIMYQSIDELAKELNISGVELLSYIQDQEMNIQVLCVVSKQDSKKIKVAFAQLSIEDLPLIWTESRGDTLSAFRSAFNGFRTQYALEQIPEIMSLTHKGKPRIRKDGQPCNPQEIIKKLLRE